MSRTAAHTTRKSSAPDISQTAAREEARPPAPVRAAAHQRFGHRLSQIETGPDIRAAEPENRTGLPDSLKAGAEALAGIALDDVRVHYDSPRPEGLAARAFTQGTEIHLGAGEEHTLGHEVWHVVQQKQGRVQPTSRVAGHPLNDDIALEAEADSISARLGAGPESAAARALAPDSAPAGPSASGPVQRMPKRKAFDKKVATDPAQQAAVDNIGDAIDAYHQIKPKNDNDYQARLTALADMERHLYGWFDTHVTGTIAETTNGPHMKKMLEENQAEHRKLVSKIAKKPALVPISTAGMQATEVDDVRQTWRSVVDGTGNLSIKAGKSEGSFKKRQQANIAKLLQHPAGREIVTGLSAPQTDANKKVQIGSSFKKELKTLGRQDPHDSQAVPRTQDGDVTSMAFQQVQADKLAATDVPVVNPGTRASGPQNFNQFVTSLPGGTTHFQHEGDTYKTGTGIGSYVKMAGKGKVEANVGTRMQETVVPEFVTLGHELGHSQRMLQGTAVPFAADMDKFGFQGTNAQKRLWNNAEEYVNIAGPENAIRAEHGIAGRQFHAGDLAEAKMPLQRSRLDDLLRHPLSAPKNQPTLPGYDDLFDTYGKMMAEPSEEGKKRILMRPSVSQGMDLLEHHINLAQNNV